MLDRAEPHDHDPIGSAADRRIRVCHAVATAEGATWHVEQLERLTAQYGYEAVSLLPDVEGTLEGRLSAVGIRSLKTSYDFPSLPPFRDLVERVILLAVLFRRERFDVVHTVLWHSMLIGRLAGWLADVPVRVHMAAGVFHQEAPITRWMDRDTCWMETALIGGCQYLGSIYGAFGVSEKRRRVVYFGPDEGRFRPDETGIHDLRAEQGWPESTPVIAHIAWFYARVPDSRWAPGNVAGHAVKGHEDLIRAAPFILARYPDAKIAFIGSGWLEGGHAYMTEMQALAEELGLRDSVLFLGARSDVNEILKGIDVAVQPSRNECCGGTLEALLMECPTVATRVGGMPEIVVDGKTGVVVNPADPKDLARGICSLLDDRRSSREFGKAGRAHVLEIATLAKTVSGLDTIYREFLFKNGRRRGGYRLWLSILRLPVLLIVCAYLHWRLYRLEYHYLPKWNSGWRPWQLQSLLAAPAVLWGQPAVFQVRYWLWCNTLKLKGNAFGLWQRSTCRFYFMAGTLHGYRQRLLCWSYRILGHLHGVRQRTVCQAYVVTGTLRSYSQRLLRWSHRLFGRP
jgi:glycosyltransferase involved in cell wall biosynthesis